MRGVVRGVRDYGNRMGIPTTSGAIQFDPTYIYNPLVFCGTAGVIPQSDIAKEMKPGLAVVVIGGRTGKDGLHGATFSSAAMGEASHEEDQQAVQIGNPIEEKKTLDVILEARERGLIEFITDCGAGGFSSAAGEMLSETGGNLYLSARNESYDLGSREAEAVLAAIGRDLANGDWGTYDWFRVSNGGDYAMDLSLEFDGPDGEGHDYISISLTPAMGETVAALRQLGLVTDADLVTYRELEPENYAWEQAAADAAPASADVQAAPLRAVEVLSVTGGTR